LTFLLLVYYAREPEVPRDILPLAALVDFVLALWLVLLT
jgi:hypothetical protein